MPRPKPDRSTPVRALDRKIREVRKSRSEASSARGFTAVSSLHRLEYDLMNARFLHLAEEVAQRKAAEEAASQDPARVEEEVRTMLARLPDVMRERLTVFLWGLAPAGLRAEMCDAFQRGQRLAEARKKA